MSQQTGSDITSPAREGYGRVGGALSWSIVGKAFRGVLLFFNAYFVVRLLGPADFGYLSVTRTLAGFFTVIAWMGLTQALLRYLPEMRVGDNARGARRLVLATLGVQFFIWAVLLAAAFLFRARIERAFGAPVGTLLILATGLLLVDLFVTTWSQVLTSWYEMRDLSVAQVLGSAAYLALALAALHAGYGPAGVLWAAGLSNLGVGIYLAVDSRRLLAAPAEGQAPRGDMVPMRRVLRYSLPFAAISVLNLITWRQSETLILKIFRPAEQVAFFDRAYNIPQQFLDFVPAAIWPLMLASFSEVYARDPRALPRAVSAYYRLLFFLAVPISVWGASLAFWALPGVYGRAWSPAGPLATAFFLLFSMTYFSTPLSLCFYVMEMTWVNLVINLAGALWIVGLNFLLIPRFGIWGAMVPVGTVIVVSPFLYHAIVRRKLPEVRIPWRFIGRCYLASLPLAVLGLLAYAASSRLEAAGHPLPRGFVALLLLLGLSGAAAAIAVLSVRAFGLLGEEERVLVEKLRLPLKHVWLRFLFREARA